MRRTKLVCTIGPASRGRVDELIAAGMDVARLNFSHGSPLEWTDAARRLRAAAEAAGRPLGLLADLPGPKVRLGDVAGDELELREGEEFLLLPPGDPPSAEPTAAPTNHGGLSDDLRPGDRVLLADGAAELRVADAADGVVRCEVSRGGLVRSGAGVNVPSERLSLPAVTDRDRDGLRCALELGADFVAQSFVRGAEDVRQLRELMRDAAIPVMAKIETRAAIDDLDRILEVVDAVMLARGDLGVEVPFAEVPVLQKQVVGAAGAVGVPVVVATQMLESMVSSPRPTRAEASDVANAVLDGADAVMLSAETAIGDYPVLAAEAAVEICAIAEQRGRRYVVPPDLAEQGSSDPRALAAAAVALVRHATDPPVRAIACFTRTGLTARLLSTVRPGVPILALSPDESVVRRLTIWRAVLPCRSAEPEDTDAMIEVMDRSLRDMGLGSGDRVVMVGSIPFGRARTNFLKLHRL